MKNRFHGSSKIIHEKLQKGKNFVVNPDKDLLPSTSISGTFTVGVGQNYTTLTAAVAALNSSLITGPVTFILTDATYTNETFPITISNNSGSGPNNTVTIKPAPGISPVISGNSESILELSHASYIIVDGSNCGGTDRSLTIQNLSATTYTNVIGIHSLGYGLGSTHITVRNCIIANGNKNSANYGIELSDGGPTGFDSQYINILNNQIKKAFVGIEAIGYSYNPITYLNIKGNDIGDNIISESIEDVGINLMSCEYDTLMNNTIFNINSISPNPTGIYIYMCDYCIVMNNTVHDIYRTNVGSGWGMYFCGDQNLTLVNNLIYKIGGVGWDTFLCYSGPVGIFLDQYIYDLLIYHNSVYMSGSTYGISSAIVFFTSDIYNIDFRDNILMNTISSTNSDGSPNFAIYSFNREI